MAFDCLWHAYEYYKSYIQTHILVGKEINKWKKEMTKNFICFLIISFTYKNMNKDHLQKKTKYTKWDKKNKWYHMHEMWYIACAIWLMEFMEIASQESLFQKASFTICLAIILLTVVICCIFLIMLIFNCWEACQSSPQKHYGSQVLCFICVS